MEIRKKIIPHKYRNKYLRNSGSGSFASGSVSFGSKSGAMKAITSEEEAEISDTTLFTSKRVIREIDTAIDAYDSELLDKLKAFIVQNKTEIIELLKDDSDLLGLNKSSENKITI